MAKAVVYKMYWAKTGHFYIGCTENLERRKKQHRCDMFNGVHTNRLTQFLYTIYGLPEFKVIRYGVIKEMRKLESYLVDKKRFDSGLCNKNPTNDFGTEILIEKIVYIINSHSKSHL